MFSKQVFFLSLILIIVDICSFANACYAKFDAKVPTHFNLDALQHLPTKYYIEPNIPNNFSINTNLPNNFSIETNIPNNFTFSVNVPSDFTLDPHIPSDFFINGVIPTNYSLDPHLPNNFTIDLNIPSDYSITLEIPESISDVVKYLGYVAAAYIAVLAANLLLKLIRDFVKSIAEIVSMLVEVYRRCCRRRKGFKTSNMTIIGSKRHSPSPALRSPSRENLCADDFEFENV